MRMRSDSAEDAPLSVIHVPPGFRQFVENPKSSPPPSIGTPNNQKQQQRTRSASSPSEQSENTVVSPATPERSKLHEDRRLSSGMITTPIDTNIPRKNADFGITPRASSAKEVEEEWKRKRNSTGLEDIAEHDDHEKGDEEEDEEEEVEEPNVQSMGQALQDLSNVEEDVGTLRVALVECWTLCNTLAGLSSIHRERMFSFDNTGSVQEQAWKSCWRLCQKLYDSWNEGQASQVEPTLELCREFCQALFEARQRADESSDSILRVSFELNNHLYNTNDRALPEAFRERTLDFYLTMCHRLMKQRTSLPEETDSLLRACWSLAEMLFSLRQSNRDGKPADEELMCSAVQACWELCDLFREGWTQVRPERGTPRPVQRVFPPFSNSSQKNGGSNPPSIYAPSQIPSRPESSMSLTDSFRKMPNPETPTTIFDEPTDISPEEPEIPNIMVLGPEMNNIRSPTANTRWSSSAASSSSRSSLSDASHRTLSATGVPINSSASSTPIPPAEVEDPHLTRLKVLILKAALNSGYTPYARVPTGVSSTNSNSSSTATHSTSLSLLTFVKSLPTTTFGSAPWQLKLLEQYKRLVLTDPTLRARENLPFGRRMSAAEIARAVQWMARAEGFSWLRDLFRLVCGFFPEDGTGAAGKGWVVT
ncbi:hypothetical protein P152DRAFT_286417 [Eremomyces bilateralis CBS 781.70]|uniref:DUF7624 domain-containing protein n=1 Tax=Eremomyces bilateralis CBS 781.70 TaxID=1392243 RepID=A0A6G1G6E7_9PEZI|nr:uncharacterized protein P152DRAFT_286417 [Eremomyces bilateralis CBS 781.70]KAF1813604.1 hypothetical protein P152DRAFT_286417 [Eremomyces bilateralis CBS 781.70]